jgi:hypothetical protein
MSISVALRSRGIQLLALFSDGVRFQVQALYVRLVYQISMYNCRVSSEESHGAIIPITISFPFPLNVLSITFHSILLQPPSAHKFARTATPPTRAPSPTAAVCTGPPAFLLAVAATLAADALAALILLATLASRTPSSEVMLARAADTVAVASSEDKLEALEAAPAVIWLMALLRSDWIAPAKDVASEAMRDAIELRGPRGSIVIAGNWALEGC